ncbi:MAG: phosphotransferase [Mycoplasma sp.]|nr:phosphotransferase [Mycoplasma sp.]
MKKSKIKDNIFFKKLSISEITQMGITVALLTVLKFFDRIIPGPGGFAVIEIWNVVLIMLVLFLNFRSSIAVVLITPWVWFATGQITLGPGGFLSFFFDYYFPTIIMILPAINFQTTSKTNYLWIILMMFISFFLKFVSLTLSGIWFWETGFIASMAINWIIPTATLGVSIAAFVGSFSKINNLKYILFSNNLQLFSERKIMNNYICKKLKIQEKDIQKVKKYYKGIANSSYKVMVNDIWWQIRIPHTKMANWDNESRIYSAIHDKESFYYDNYSGIMLKKWIKGEIITKWTKQKEDSLFKSLIEFHKIKVDNVEKHDWHKYDDFFSKLEDNLSTQNKYKGKLKSKYNELLTKYKDEKLVISHNDISGKNMLWNGKEVILIDFEWVRMNSEYFDFAHIFVTEGVDFKSQNLDKEKLKDYKFLVNTFSLLWVLSVDQTREMRTIKKRLLNNYELI